MEAFLVGLAAVAVAAFVGGGIALLISNRLQGRDIWWLKQHLKDVEEVKLLSRDVLELKDDMKIVRERTHLCINSDVELRNQMLDVRRRLDKMGNGDH